QDSATLRSTSQKVMEDTQKDLKAVTLLLENNRKDYQKNVELLQNELKKQQIEFDKKIQAFSQNSENAAAAAMLKAKNEFAAERLEFLKRLDGMEKNLSAKNGELVKMQQDLLKKLNNPIPTPPPAQPAPAVVPPTAPATAPPAEK
ncbi:MAG: hypothetical protein RRY34_02490, partial [Victivallaceae bacterium]